MSDQRPLHFPPHRHRLEELSPGALARRAREEGYSRDEVRRLTREELICRLWARDQLREAGLPPGYADRWPGDPLEVLAVAGRLLPPSRNDAAGPSHPRSTSDEPRA
jgi:hypothetical protein